MIAAEFRIRKTTLICFLRYELFFIRNKSNEYKSNLKNMRLKSGSYVPKKIFFICFDDIPSKMMKKCFLFYPKSSFRSQDI